VKIVAKAGAILGLVVSLFAVSGPASASGTLLLDSGGPIQGGLIYGRTDPGAKVVFDGRQVRVSPKGHFLIGFTRDAAPASTLKVTFPDGSTETKTFHVKKRNYKIQRIDGLPPKMVTPPKEVLDRIRRENRMIKEVRAIDSAEPFFLKGWIWPATGRISGVYGSQRVLNGKPRRPHFGVDVAAPTGTPVVAPSDGIVTLVEKDLYYTGGTIIIDHGHGLSSAFLHMHDVTVKKGQRVKQGEKIGTIGKTGRATGPHLDWRINLFDARLDPQLLVPPMPKGQ
jgi:murein DD-endopeptidase MepM/ murein hydrolase activator NlpD